MASRLVHAALDDDELTIPEILLEAFDETHPQLAQEAQQCIEANGFKAGEADSQEPGEVSFQTASEGGGSLFLKGNHSPDGPTTSSTFIFRMASSVPPANRAVFPLSHKKGPAVPVAAHTDGLAFSRAFHQELWVRATDAFGHQSRSLHQAQCPIA